METGRLTRLLMVRELRPFGHILCSAYDSGLDHHRVPEANHIVPKVIDTIRATDANLVASGRRARRNGRNQVRGLMPARDPKKHG